MIFVWGFNLVSIIFSTTLLGWLMRTYPSVLLIRKLQSPTTSAFSSRMLSTERKLANSWKKSLVVRMFLAGRRRRYTHTSRNVCFSRVRHNSVFSNEPKERCVKKPYLRCYRLIIATSSPLPDTCGLCRKEKSGGVILLVLASSLASHQPRFSETEYIQIVLNNQIIHVEGLVNSRPGVPQTHDEICRYPWARCRAAGRWGRRERGAAVHRRRVDCERETGTASFARRDTCGITDRS